MSSKPTIIFVPGAWFPADCWRKVTPLLEAQGYKCVCVALPSAQSDPSKTFFDDVQAVRRAIESETTQGRDVVIVVHSYGGLPGHSAIKDLPSSSGHVLGFAMLSSGFTMTGMSFLAGAGGKPPPSWRADAESGFAVIVTPPREFFFHDLPIEESDYWASKLGQQSLKALAEGGEYAYAGWKDVPVWYLAATEDRGLPVEAQRYFVQLARDDGADVTLREVQSSHSPMLSKPKETADFILEAVADFVAKKTKLDS